MFRRTKFLPYQKSFAASLIALLLLFAFPLQAFAGDSAAISGVVKDASGAVVADAEVALLTAQQIRVASTKTDAQGRFNFPDIPTGNYLVLASARDFSSKRLAVDTRTLNAELEIVIEPFLKTEQVTVTANQGVAESVEKISQQVNIINEQAISERAKSVTAQLAWEEPGANLQRTSSSISGIVVRGVTGNKVNIYVDGIRYTTSAQRGGISTFLNLIDQTNLQSVEILRGPNSAQYGSDAIGGSIQFLSRKPQYLAGGKNLHGHFSVNFNSADVSYGSNLTTTYASENFGLLSNFAARRVNTLRPGKGIDSHNAVTRFFGLPSSIAIGERLPDTAFTQYGGLLKAYWTPATNSNFVVNYSRAQQDGGKRYDQLLGGDGTLIGDLRNLMNDLFYVRFDQLNAGWFDSFSAAYSFNSQREERVNQGGNGNPRATLTHEYERINISGLQASLTKLIGLRQNLLFGGEYYHERLDSPAFGVNPVTSVTTLRRPRIPDNALYQSGGIYVQDVFEAIPNRLRLMGNLRYSAASYEVRAADSPRVGGQPLWVDDSLDVSNLTFRVGAVFTPVEGLSLMANIARGFRAPHATDLGSLGLVGTGFEVSAAEIAGLGATIGTTGDDTAISTGRAVEQLKPETSLNYEGGLRFYKGRVDTDLTVFVNDIDDNIVKQTLILPQGAVGQRLGSEPITSQLPNGAVFVALATTPVLVRANFGTNRIFGVEHTFDYKLASAWSLRTVYTYIHTRDKNGTPAPDGWLKLRYAPVGKRFWVEPYVHAADRQERLSSIDLADRRTGARRTNASIAAFFQNGATARGLVGAGADGRIASPDDILIATGETLSQIQTRVLGPARQASSLFTAVPGYITFNLRGGFRVGENHEFLIDFENIGDRNYRGVDWGLDAPGRGVFIRYNTRF
jgi:hemoglobin/transferrin/lactoferrin receptor protein